MNKKNSSNIEPSNGIGEPAEPTNRLTNLSETETTVPIDPFDPESLRLDQSSLNYGAAKKLLTTIPVRKPHKQDFVRVLSRPDYRVPVALIDFERDTYVVAPQFAAQLSPTEYYMATVYVCINRQKVVSLWPVKTPAADGRQMEWYTSAQTGAELAMIRWVRITANMDLGAYEISEAIADYGEPEWPDLPFRELLRIGFKTRMISDESHTVIQKLRGLA
jgi:hypothetical protein